MLWSINKTDSKYDCEFPSSQEKGKKVQITLILHISEKPTKNKIYVM